MIQNIAANPKTCDICSDPDYAIIGGYCLKSKCQSYQYKDVTDFFCKPCHSSCKTCVGPGVNGCTSCSDGFALSEYYFEENWRQLGIGRECWKCSTDCDGCHPSYYRSCILCRQPYVPYYMTDSLIQLERSLNFDIT